MPSFRCAGRPKVAILSTGDEVVPPGSDPGPDQVISSISFGARRADRGARRRGHEPRHRPGHAGEHRHPHPRRHCRRHSPHHRRRLGRRARSGQAPRFDSEGFELDFRRSPCGRASRCSLAGSARQRVLGLPGNPVSALVCGDGVPRADAARICSASSQPGAASSRPCSATIRGRTVRASIICARVSD